MFNVGQRVVRTETWEEQAIYAGDEGTVVDVSGLEKKVPVIRVRFDGKGIRTVLACKMEPRDLYVAPCPLPPSVAKEYRERVEALRQQRPCDFVIDFGPDLGMFLRDGMTSKQARAALDNPPHLLDQRIKEAFKHLPKVKLRASDPRNHIPIVRTHAAPQHFRWSEDGSGAIVIWGKP